MGGDRLMRCENYREGKLRKERRAGAWEPQVGRGALGPHLGAATETGFRRWEV